MRSIGAAFSMVIRGVFAVRSIYLDYNATTPLAPVAQEAMLPYLADRFADPSGDHLDGRAIGEAVEDARGRLAAAIRSATDEIIWTSGATEASNFALRGVLEPLLHAGETPHLVVSAVDHPAVQGPARYLQRCGAELTVVPVNDEGLVDPEEVVDALQPNTRLVSIVHANEDIGVVQPIAEVARLCKQEGVIFHTDASQSFGKQPIALDNLDADLLSISAHKAYGPKGLGALFVRRGVRLEPQLWGDRHEAGQRAGMPNVAGIVGFGAISGVAAASREESTARAAKLRSSLVDRLTEAISTLYVYGPTDGQRLAGTLCVSAADVIGADWLAAAQEVCATALGSGALPDCVTLSPTLRAIDATPEQAAGAIRLSVGWYTDEEDIAAAADALVTAWERLR